MIQRQRYLDKLIDKKGRPAFAEEQERLTRRMAQGERNFELYKVFDERMKKEYDRFWSGERDAKAKALGLTREEVSTLASIVCEESNHLPELPAIAGVYINRLKAGMKLDADPTVKFALGDPSLKRILYRHLTVDSPYNTYRHAGLPPGPITIPQISGIDAVLNYQKHGYYYFCASDKLDGTHKFAESSAEHNANARKYQSAISRLGIR